MSFFKNEGKPVKFEYLTLVNNYYLITRKREYRRVSVLKNDTIKEVFDFAYDMAFTDKGQHRNYRSGGIYNRKNGEIFANTFQGKIAECAACDFFYVSGIDTTLKPDYTEMPEGEWDSYDLKVKNKKIAVKSTKHFGQLLLLESKDWNEKGEYIPNLDRGNYEYDAFILIRIKPDCERLMRSKRLLYQNNINKTELFDLISDQIWEYDYAGFITKEDLIYIINNNYVLPQKAMLNGRTKMDAENYYVQAGDLRKIETISDIFK